MMKTFNKNNQFPVKDPDSKRREFLKKGMALGALAGITGMGFITSCNVEEEEEVTPSEDLMREHGVLNRILLILMKTRNLSNCSVILTACTDRTNLEKIPFYFRRSEKSYPKMNILL